jgi:hypothetical protein
LQWFYYGNHEPSLPPFVDRLPEYDATWVEDPTRESKDNIETNKLVELLQEMFQNTSSWPTPEQVHSFHLAVERDPVR